MRDLADAHGVRRVVRHRRGRPAGGARPRRCAATPPTTGASANWCSRPKGRAVGRRGSTRCSPRRRPSCCRRCPPPIAPTLLRIMRKLGEPAAERSGCPPARCADRVSRTAPDGRRRAVRGQGPWWRRARHRTLRCQMFRIVRRESLTPTHLPLGGRGPRRRRVRRGPGQFVMVRLHDGAERIPLTIADFDAVRGTVTVVVQALGRSTAEMRDRYHEGDTFADFVGPLGMPTEIDGPTAGERATWCSSAAASGVAPVFPQLRAFKQAGNRTTCIVGFRSAELSFWHDELGEWADELIVCTDDGSAGRAGLGHRGAGRRGGERPARPRGGHRPDGDDARVRRGHPAGRRAHRGVAEHDHGRRHRHVRLVPCHASTATPGSPASTAPTSTRTASTSTSCSHAQRRFKTEEQAAAGRLRAPLPGRADAVRARAGAPTRSCARSSPPRCRCPNATRRRGRARSTR